MQIYTDYASRQEYLENQIARSVSKFRFCKVSADDVQKYLDIVKATGPILCLGTRNGRELDLFRHGIRGTLDIVRRLERVSSNAFAGRFPWLERLGMSALSTHRKPMSGEVWGVELNPMGARKDVLVGSFDELPVAWTAGFRIVYSNCLDHAQDPSKAIKEWVRMLMPGGYLILAYVEGQSVNADDPVGHITLDDVKGLVRLPMVFYQHKGSRNHYTEAIFRNLPNDGVRLVEKE